MPVADEMLLKAPLQPLAGYAFQYTAGLTRAVRVPFAAFSNHSTAAAGSQESAVWSTLPLPAPVGKSRAVTSSRLTSGASTVPLPAPVGKSRAVTSRESIGVAMLLNGRLKAKMRMRMDLSIVMYVN